MGTGPFSFSNRPSRRALYLQVQDELTARIASSAWKPGESIPNEVDLARELGVSAGTVRKALELMETQRVIRRRQGRGTFVNDQTSAELEARFSNFRGPDGEIVNGSVASVKIDEGVADDHERRRLQLPAADPVYRIRRVHVHRGQTYMAEHATVPAALFPGLAGRRKIAASITELAREYGILLGRAEQRLSPDEPTPAAAEALGVAPGTPVMQRDRVVFLLNGPPAEWAVAQCHLDGGYYVAELR
jgi:GntR family transcriptional regulator